MVAVLFTRSSAATDSVKVTVNQKTDRPGRPGRVSGGGAWRVSGHRHGHGVAVTEARRQSPALRDLSCDVMLSAGHWVFQRVRAMPSSLRIALVVLLLLGAPALHAQTCTFTSSPAGIAFSPLNPSAPSTQTAFMSVVIKCVSASGAPTPAFTFTGLYGSAPLRMKHAVQASYIPYTVAPTRTSVVGSSQVWRVTATVLGADYTNAFAGSYSDALIVAITP